MARLRSIEILGGPLDGKRVLWDVDVDCMEWHDGLYRYQYVVDEIWTGNRMRTVIRHVATVPTPRNGGK
jgi:hypothetical protein